jgi:hypothetical protein
LLSSPLHALKHRHLWRASSQILSNLAYVNTSTAACVNIGFLVRLGARGHGVHL